MSDLIDRQTAIETAIEAADKWDGGYSSEREGIIRKFFDKIPAAQPDHIADISKKAEGDCISRQAAIDALDEQIEQCNKALGSFDISPKDEYAIKVERASLKAYRELLENLPTAQPEQNEKWIYNSPTTMKCDRCGFAIKDWDWHRFKYCPNCGVDMRGGDSR